MKKRQSPLQRILSTEFIFQAIAAACVWKAFTVPHEHAQTWLASAGVILGAGRALPTERVDEALDIPLLGSKTTHHTEEP
ncbi:hypothetical protein ACQ4M4_12890 [Leptolyngbya sp. AN02str]|uniref:hypothetical protein n=1 Tax=Leptolyngbya sp. AN02str TaxID=3423363 RepID=UPI003D311101